MKAGNLSLFEAWGIEIEYALVDADTLDVAPLADVALREGAGADEWVSDHDDGPIAWSNELVAHVLEMKTNGPVKSLEGVAGEFQASVGRLAALLARHGARPMPTAQHPWMDPRRETRLWPHDYAEVYRAYDALYDCARHGWANVQSVHVNLPFADEGEFGRLMAAARIVLPLVPALCASSPVVEGRATGLLDNRLEFYRTNSSRTPSMTGSVVPEPVYGFDEYHARVLAPIKRELVELGADPALIGNEWTNARGAIARFDRMALEIRLIDSQECPRADLAMAAAVGGLVRGLVEERWSRHAEQREVPTEGLAELLRAAARSGRATPVGDTGYGALFGAAAAETLGDVLAARAREAFAGPAELEEPLAVALEHGSLAERVLAALGQGFGRPELERVLRELCGCLSSGALFRP